MLPRSWLYDGWLLFPGGSWLTRSDMRGLRAPAELGLLELPVLPFREKGHATFRGGHLATSPEPCGRDFIGRNPPGQQRAWTLPNTNFSCQAPVRVASKARDRANCPGGWVSQSRVAGRPIARGEVESQWAVCSTSETRPQSAGSDALAHRLNLWFYLAAGPDLARRLPGTRRYHSQCAGAEPQPFRRQTIAAGPSDIERNRVTRDVSVPVLAAPHRTTGEA